MKLLATFLFAFLSLLASASAADGIAESSVTEACRDSEEKCNVLQDILLGRHSIKRCVNHEWIDVEVCDAGHVCSGNPSPRCTVPIAESCDEHAGNDKASAVTSDVPYADEIHSTGVNCREDEQKCGYLSPIHRHTIKRCNGHQWVITKVCDLKDRCEGTPIPQCFAPTIKARDETPDDDAPEANSANKADLPCLKCKKFRDKCFRMFFCGKIAICRQACTNWMKRILVEDGRQERYRGTCADYCPQLCR